MKKNEQVETNRFKLARTTKDVDPRVEKKKSVKISRGLMSVSFVKQVRFRHVVTDSQSNKV